MKVVFLFFFEIPTLTSATFLTERSRGILLQINSFRIYFNTAGIVSTGSATSYCVFSKLLNYFSELVVGSAPMGLQFKNVGGEHIRSMTDNIPTRNDFPNSIMYATTSGGIVWYREDNKKLYRRSEYTEEQITSLRYDNNTQTLYYNKIKQDTMQSCHVAVLPGLFKMAEYCEIITDIDQKRKTSVPMELEPVLSPGDCYEITKNVAALRIAMSVTPGSAQWSEDLHRYAGEVAIVENKQSGPNNQSFYYQTLRLLHSDGSVITWPFACCKKVNDSTLEDSLAAITEIANRHPSKKEESKMVKQLLTEARGPRCLTLERLRRILKHAPVSSSAARASSNSTSVGSAVWSWSDNQRVIDVVLRLQSKRALANKNNCKFIPPPEHVTYVINNQLLPHERKLNRLSQSGILLSLIEDYGDTHLPYWYRHVLLSGIGSVPLLGRGSYIMNSSNQTMQKIARCNLIESPYCERSASHSNLLSGLDQNNTTGDVIFIKWLLTRKEQESEIQQDEYNSVLNLSVKPLQMISQYLIFDSSVKSPVASPLFHKWVLRSVLFNGKELPSEISLLINKYLRPQACESLSDVLINQSTQPIDDEEGLHLATDIYQQGGERSSTLHDFYLCKGSVAVIHSQWDVARKHFIKAMRCHKHNDDDDHVSDNSSSRFPFLSTLCGISDELASQYSRRQDIENDKNCACCQSTQLDTKQPYQFLKELSSAANIEQEISKKSDHLISNREYQQQNQLPSSDDIPDSDCPTCLYHLSLCYPVSEATQLLQQANVLLVTSDGDRSNDFIQSQVSLQLAQCLAISRNYQEAIHHFEISYKITGSSTAVNWLAKLYQFESSNYKEGIMKARSILKSFLEPIDEETSKQRSLYYRDHAAIATSLASVGMSLFEVECALRKSPKSSPLHQLKAAIHCDLGDCRAAIGTLTKSINFNCHPSDLLQRALYYQQIGSARRAIRDLCACLLFQPLNEMAKRMLSNYNLPIPSAEKLHQNFYSRNGHVDKAASLYQWLCLQPLNPHVHWRVSQFFFRLGNRRVVQNYWCKAARDSCDPLWTPFFEGLLSEAARDCETAVYFFSQAVQNLPQEFECHLMLAYSLASLQRFDKSTSVLLCAVNLASHPSHYCIIYNNVGYNYRCCKMYTKALSYFDKSKDFLPYLHYNFFNPFSNASEIYFMSGEQQRAVDEIYLGLKMIIEVKPAMLEELLSRGNFTSVNEVLPLCDQIKALDPYNEFSYRIAAAIMWDGGKWESGLTEINQSVELTIGTLSLTMKGEVLHLLSSENAEELIKAQDNAALALLMDHFNESALRLSNRCNP